jgi:ubiquinone biosynthesis accessory factor UbiJ
MANLPAPSIVLRALNHLIEQERWAHDLLLPREGQSISITLPIGEFQLGIQEGMFVNASDSTNLPSVILSIPQEAIWTFLKDGKSGAMKFVKISGDIDFAADLNRLAADLKWEVEEDLSKLVGDATARRVVLESQKMVHQTQLAMNDLKGGIRDYLVYEKNILVDSQQMNDFKSELRLLRDQIDRAEKKVNQLQQAINSKQTLST